MADLHWVPAERDARSILQQFTCAEPYPRSTFGKRLPHPKPFQADVQSAIRDAKPPFTNSVLDLGFDADGLAAVAWYEFVVPRAETFIKAIAVAQHHRGHQGAVADEALHRVLFRTAAEFSDSGRESAMVWGKVHPANRECVRLMERTGFACTGVEGDFDIWQIAIDW